ncbi:hypothetical protein P7K49_009118 [Saguinus oedipus]|uniref:Uncharacterized protein n=1 Tax=Saguinus oedipus TaxID=9490 RepID=A0ABQ9VZR3_SAGOE|nr:hypothetical protein P7K49_009118 [Saguinus oedipus]
MSRCGNACGDWGGACGAVALLPWSYRGNAWVTGVTVVGAVGATALLSWNSSFSPCSTPGFSWRPEPSSPGQPWAVPPKQTQNPAFPPLQPEGRDHSKASPTALVPQQPHFRNLPAHFLACFVMWQQLQITAA